LVQKQHRKLFTRSSWKQRCYFVSNSVSVVTHPQSVRPSAVPTAVKRSSRTASRVLLM